jgi:hypothetical protein
MSKESAIREILLYVISLELESYPDFLKDLEEDQTLETMENWELEEYITEYEGLGALEEFRDSGEDTNLPPSCYSRNYEVDFHAKTLPSGVTVGWDYLSGGGKHGDPSGAIDWLNTVKELTFTSKEITVIEKTYSVVE